MTIRVSGVINIETILKIEGCPVSMFRPVIRKATIFASYKIDERVRQMGS